MRPPLVLRNVQAVNTQLQEPLDVLVVEVVQLAKPERQHAKAVLVECTARTALVKQLKLVVTARIAGQQHLVQYNVLQASIRRVELCLAYKLRQVVTALDRVLPLLAHLLVQRANIRVRVPQAALDARLATTRRL